MKIITAAGGNNTQCQNLSNLSSNQLLLKVGARAIFVPHGGRRGRLPSKDISRSDDRRNQSIGFELSPFRPAGAKSPMKWNWEKRWGCWEGKKGERTNMGGRNRLGGVAKRERERKRGREGEQQREREKKREKGWKNVDGWAGRYEEKLS